MKTLPRALPAEMGIVYTLAIVYTGAVPTDTISVTFDDTNIQATYRREPSPEKGPLTLTGKASA